MLRQYLLGQKPEADLSQVEERLMTESSLYEELLILEDELVDEYIHGQMSAGDRINFENYFLQSPERREKLRFAKALRKYVNLAQSAEPADQLTIEDSLQSPDEAVTSPAPRMGESDSTNKPAPQPLKKTRSFSFWPTKNAALNYALAAAAVVIVVGVSWMVVRNLRTTSGPGVVYAVTLAPGGPTRDGGGELQTVSIPQGTDTVQFRLTLPPDQPQDYSVQLLAGDGVTIWQREGLRAESGKRVLEFNIPASLIKHDDYRFKLRSRVGDSYGEIASYNFRVSK